jgi:hypothetical protein
MSELKPCPFCGEEAEYRPDHYVRVKAHDNPNSECVLEGYDTFAVTPESWNRRADHLESEPSWKAASDRQKLGPCCEDCGHELPVHYNNCSAPREESKEGER